MRAFRLVGPQKTEVCEVPIPEPGPGQVLVKVAGAGLCHSDLHLMHAPALPNCPFTFGHETAGWVERLGAGVTGLAAGEAVVVHGCRGTRGELREVVSLAQEGRIRVHTEQFALEDTAKAYELLEAGRVRAIVTP